MNPSFALDGALPSFVASLLLPVLLLGVAACAGHSAKPPAESCTNIDVLPDELSCASDTDCFLVVTGQVCPGYVPTRGTTLGTLCPGGAANASGASRIASVLAAIPSGGDAGLDSCDALPGTPRCLAGQCTVCGPFPTGEAACFDAGPTGAADGG